MQIFNCTQLKQVHLILVFGDTINMKTTAPIVYNNPHMLVNGYHSEQSFVNFTQKESKDRSDRLDMADVSTRYNDEVQKQVPLHFNTINDKGLLSNYEIYDISTTGALIKNDGHLQAGKTTTINIKFDNIDIDVEAKVVNINGNMANIEFNDLPKDVANLILYRYMQQKNSMKISTNRYGLID